MPLLREKTNPKSSRSEELNDSISFECGYSKNASTSTLSNPHSYFVNSKYGSSNSVFSNTSKGSTFEKEPGRVKFKFKTLEESDGETSDEHGPYSVSDNSETNIQKIQEGPKKLLNQREIISIVSDRDWNRLDSQEISADADYEKVINNTIKIRRRTPSSHRKADAWKQKQLEEKLKDKWRTLQYARQTLTLEQENAIRLHKEVRDLPGDLEPVESLVYVEINHVKHFLICDSNDEENVNDSGEILDCVTSELLQAHTQYLENYTEMLDYGCEFPIRASENFRTRFEGVLAWLTQAALLSVTLYEDQGRDQIAVFFVECNKSTMECSHLTTVLSQFSARCLSEVTALFNQIELLKKGEPSLRRKLKKLTREKTKLNEYLKDLMETNEDLKYHLHECKTELGNINMTDVKQQKQIELLRQGLATISKEYSKAQASSAKINEHVVVLQKKLAARDSENRQKLQDNGKIIFDSLQRINTLEDRAAILHESFEETLEGEDLQLDALREDVATLKNEVKKRERKWLGKKQKCLTLTEELVELTHRMVKADSVMETLVEQTDPEFRQPYPLKDVTAEEREGRVRRDLRRSKETLNRINEEEKRRQRDGRKGDDRELTWYREVLVMREEVEEENRKGTERLGEVFKQQRLQLNKGEIVVDETENGCVLHDAVKEVKELDHCFRCQTSIHQVVLKRADGLDHELARKSYQASLRKQYDRDYTLAKKGREQILSMINVAPKHNKEALLKYDTGKLLRTPGRTQLVAADRKQSMIMTPHRQERTNTATEQRDRHWKLRLDAEDLRQEISRQRIAELEKTFRVPQNER